MSYGALNIPKILLLAMRTSRMTRRYINFRSLKLACN